MHIPKMKPIITRTKQEQAAFVDALIKTMTIKEKIGQLYQAPYFSDFVTGHAFDASSTVQDIKEGSVGSVLSVYDERTLFKLQETAVNESRLGIPLLFCFDVIHGYSTAFPTNLAMAATWNPGLVEEGSKAVAYETSHKGIHLTFSPMVDIVRDPRWGRVMESNGEDPYLSSVFARAYVRGYQQDSLKNPYAVAACVKHYIGYGAAEAGKEYNTVDISKRQIFNTYLPPFKAAVEEQVAMLMTSFNVILDRPSTANKYLLKDVLRENLKFSGVTISDYTSTEELIDHKVAEDLKDVAYQCFEAGLDHEMVSKSYILHLETLVQEGRVSEKSIDEAAKRVLTLKESLGLFENPFRNFYTDSENYMQTKKTRALAKKTALESVVMLENNGVLPLATFENVALMGPMAASKDLIGAWGALAKEKDVVSLEDALEGKVIRVDSLEALQKESSVDTVIVAFGESSMQSGEGHSRADINLSDEDVARLKDLKAMNKKVVAVIFAGRPLIVTPIIDYVDALLYAWQLGSEAGHALADLISGKTSPSGRLPMTFPRHMGQIPLYYNHLNTGRPQQEKNPDYRYRSHYIDCQNSPLYSFGYGLTYAQVTYDGVEVSHETLNNGETLNVTVTLTNTSDRAVFEVVQCYIEAKVFSISRPVNELKAFEKIMLDPHETKQHTFALTSEDFKAYNEAMQFTTEAREYYVKVGKDSAHLVQKTVRVFD